jgi:redox-sensitive bicupin YhaK (pirin superfamily)
VSPDQNDSGVWINQQAWFWLVDFTAGQSEAYTIKSSKNGAYFFVLEGTATVAGELLERRDGMGVEDTASIEIDATEDCQLLIIDLPMN